MFSNNDSRIFNEHIHFVFGSNFHRKRMLYFRHALLFIRYVQCMHNGWPNPFLEALHYILYLHILEEYRLWLYTAIWITSVFSSSSWIFPLLFVWIGRSFFRWPHKYFPFILMSNLNSILLFNLWLCQKSNVKWRRVNGDALKSANISLFICGDMNACSSSTSVLPWFFNQLFGIS